MISLSNDQISKKILSLEAERTQLSTEIEQRKRHLLQLQINKENLSFFSSEAEKIADLVDLLEDTECDLDTYCAEIISRTDANPQCDENETKLELQESDVYINRYDQLTKECERLEKELSGYKGAFAEYKRLYQRAKAIIQIKESELKRLKNELDETFPF